MKIPLYSGTTQQIYWTNGTEPFHPWDQQQQQWTLWMGKSIGLWEFGRGCQGTISMVSLSHHSPSAFRWHRNLYATICFINHYAQWTTYSFSIRHSCICWFWLGNMSPHSSLVHIYLYSTCGWYYYIKMKLQTTVALSWTEEFMATADGAKMLFYVCSIL